MRFSFCSGKLKGTRNSGRGKNQKDLRLVVTHGEYGLIASFFGLCV